MSTPEDRAHDERLNAIHDEHVEKGENHWYTCPLCDDETDDDDKADGFVLVHQPTPGALPYGVGPFPPFPELAKQLIDERVCECEVVTVLWVTFPGGIRMQVAPDPEMVAAAT